MTATPGPNNATADWPPAPDAAPLGWPAPFATGALRDWTATIMKLPLAIGLTDAAGNLVVRNDAFLATVGSGDHVATMAGPHNAATLAAAFARVLAEAAPAEVRVAFAERPQEKQAILIQPIPPGIGFAAVVSMRDVREQLRLEAQVAGATRMQSVGLLAGGIAHDFNNILTAVLMTTDQLRTRLEEDFEASAALAEIHRNSMRAAAMVEQLLAFSRQQPQKRELLDVAAVIGDLAPLIAQLVGPAVALALSGMPLRSAVMADAGQIEQIIVNLAVNARDAMDGNGRLVIDVADVSGAEIAAGRHSIIPHVDHVRIDVVDTGSGIAPEIAAKIFEPFFTTKPMGKGTGLGLSTVYGIVKQSNGFIFASPGPDGIGTRFSVFLPAAGTLATRLSAAALPIAEPAAPLASQRILLVEDDAAVRLVFERALRARGHDLVSAASGEAALALLQSDCDFDILVSDVMMPGIDGVELAGRARRLRPELPIVLVSGYAELPLHHAADARGIRFLSKPFTLPELTAVIGEAVTNRHR